MKTIVEFLLGNDKKTIIDQERKELVDKLYDEFGQYGEFERIKDDGTFHYVAETEDEARLNLPPEIFKMAKVKKATQGMGEIIYTWNIDDIIEFFDHNYKRVFSQIKDWFDYL